MDQYTVRACLLGLGLTLVGPPLWSQVYRCVGPDGSIQYSNLACPSSSSATQIRARPNSVDTTGERQQSAIAERSRRREALAAESRGDMMTVSRSDGGGMRASNTCPSDNDIRNLETRASSITLGKKEREFLQDEIRRSRQCQKGQGSYTADDWRISRDASAKQSNISQRDREAARAGAEAMHSAADPAEGNRIAAARRAEVERRADAARAATEQAGREAQRRAAKNNYISTCNDSGCWDTSGNRYSYVPGTNHLRGPSGSCRRHGQFLSCP